MFTAYCFLHFFYRIAGTGRRKYRYIFDIYDTNCLAARYGKYMGVYITSNGSEDMEKQISFFSTNTAEKG